MLRSREKNFDTFYPIKLMKFAILCFFSLHWAKSSWKEDKYARRTTHDETQTYCSRSHPSGLSLFHTTMAAAVRLFEKKMLFRSVAARPPYEIIKPHGSSISAYSFSRYIHFNGENRTNFSVCKTIRRSYDFSC